MLKVAWTLAIETLSWMDLKGLSERSALNKAARQIGVEDSKIIGLTHKMVYETVRRRNLIDFILNSALKPRSLHDLKVGLRAFLRLYVHETMLENVGFEKAVNIASMGRSILGWRGMQEVEEMLGKILYVPYDRVLQGFDDEKRTALLTFHPKWFVSYCFRLLGRNEGLRYLESATEIPPTYVRINTLKAAEKTLLKRIEDENITLQEVPRLKHAYKLIESQQPLTKTQSFRDGAFYIQDKASCLAVEIADPKAGETVLDVCAAPGAKTTYLSQLMRNKGSVYSIDYSKRRMVVWKGETKRMAAKIVIPIIADARNPLPVNLSVDCLILDPPCTSTGVFNKTPSAKWRLTSRSILGMSKIQWDMLNQCARFVKNNGCLIYSTCSITLEENEMLIERFLKWHPEFTFVKTSPRIGLPGFRGQKKCQRLYPHIHDSNGFFVAKLRKEA